MKSFAKNGVSSSFTYDADGLRSRKTVGTRKTEYQYVGDKLFYEKRGDNQTFYYFYDSYGNLSMIRYTLVGSDNSVSTATYLAQTNSQGDVVALYTKAGNLYARYEYDAWGNTLSVTDANGNEITAWYNIANANPIRYRGYYFDADLNLYYLQSRYYDSEIGRFINADSFVTTGQGVMSYNMYSYCGNNPVNRVDYTGDFWVAAALITIGVCVVLGGILGALADEPLIKKSQDATEKKHKESNPANNTFIPGVQKEDSNKTESNAALDDVLVSSSELTAKDRATNIFIGATLGLAVGGAIVSLVAVGLFSVIGVQVSAQIFAIGALAFNAEAMIFAPFYAVTLDPIEWE